MSAGGAVAAMVAATLALKRRQIIHAYRNTGATSESSARNHRELGIRDSAMFRRLTRQGLLRESASGDHYLDVEAEARDESRRDRIRAVLLVIVVVGLALLFWFDWPS